MRLVLDGDVLEVADRVECRVTIQSAVAYVVALDAETAEEFIDETSCVVVLVDSVLLGCAVGKAAKTCAVFDADTCDGVECDERFRILTAMIIGTFHKCALRISVAHLQVGADGRDEVAKDLLACNVIFIHKKRGYISLTTDLTDLTDFFFFHATN